MALDLTQAIVTGVSTLIAAASALYARRQAMPYKTKRDVCQNLLRLKDALNDIGQTGRAIGRLMHIRTFAQGNPDLGELITLLEEQNRNLIRATSEFQSLATAFEIHAPDLSGLLIHLRGKSDRIEIIYSVASDPDIERHLAASVASWEQSKLLKSPHKLIYAVSLARPRTAPDPVSITVEQDENFDLILNCIPKLTRFIKEHCPVEYLR